MIYLKPQTNQKLSISCIFLCCAKKGHNVPTKVTSNGTTYSNGGLGAEGPETTETDSSGTGGMRKSLEGSGSTPNDIVHLKRRVGLFSGVALIVGTMIGK